MRPPAPILVAHLFPELDGHLLDLLGSLSAEDWRRPTACAAWSVKDVAAHLLDTALRRVSMQRDGHAPPGVPGGFGSHEELVAHVHRLNAEWTSAAARLSPRVLIDLMRHAAADLAELFTKADPFAPALFPVSWAGESESALWFDVAREFTERWHHQRQIADAVGRPTPIDARHLQHPVLDTFLRALPHAYREVEAPGGTLVCVRVVGDAGGEWFLRREANGWGLWYDVEGRPDAAVTMDQSIAWKFLTKRTDRATARARFPGLRVEGEPAYGEPAMEVVSILA